MADTNDQTNDNTEKDPSTWVTGGEPITGAQQSYLDTLGQQTGEHVDSDSLTKAEASEKIEELQEERDGRETPANDSQDIAAETDPDLSDNEAA